MFLSRANYMQLIQNNGLIENFRQENAGAISYDLCVAYILDNTTERNKREQYNISPGETVFIASQENINLPNNIFAQIIERYSSIRKGLAIASPTYMPGHHTRIFTRITNISNDIIAIQKGDSIVSIMFYAYDKDVDKPYNGTYQGEFDFKNSGIYHDIPTPNVIKLNQELDGKLNDVKDIDWNKMRITERKILTNRVYRHFKGNLYLVLDIAIHSETKEKYIVYRSLYGDCQLFVRPYDMFISPVDKIKYPDVMQEYRFELVDL